MVRSDARELFGRRFERDPRLRRRKAGLGIQFRDATHAARVAFRRDGQRRFAPLEKDVLGREATVFARAEGDLTKHPVCRVQRHARVDGAFELARRKVARLPVLALVRTHRGNVELVVDRATERVSEERQTGRVARRHVRRQQRSRVAGRQNRCERIARVRRPDRRERAALRQDRLDRAGRSRDQFRRIRFAHHAAVGKRPHGFVVVDQPLRVAIGQARTHNGFS